MHKTLYLPVALTLAAGMPLAAQDNADWIDRTRLETCAAIGDDIARLACFDAIVSGASPIPSEEVLREQVEEDFGLDQSRSQAARDRMEEIAEDLVITSSVSGVSGNARSYILTLANGQVWRTNESGNLRHRFRGNEDVSIEKGRFGGYRLTVDGKVGRVGVVRVR